MSVCAKCCGEIGAFDMQRRTPTPLCICRPPTPHTEPWPEGCHSVCHLCQPPRVLWTQAENDTHKREHSGRECVY